MSAESIESRTHELMSMQKIELARRIAEYEDAHALYSSYAEPNVMAKGTDPEITDIAPGSADPEVLEPLPLPDTTVIEQAVADHERAVQEMTGTSDLMNGGATIEGADAAPAEDAPQ